MRRSSRRSSPAVAALVLALVTATLLASCSTAASPPATPRTGVAATSVPFNSTLMTAPGTWAVLPMGILGQPANTFWELFFRPVASTRWSLVTPPGVALNGGLTIAAAGSLLTAGIEPTNLLTYSPLAQRNTTKGTWAPGIVPGALVADPDALASSVRGGLLAVLRANSGQDAEVVESSGSVSSWTDLVAQTALESSSGASSCQVSSLTSVAFSSDGTELVGADCIKPGVVGVFSMTSGSWALAGPRLTGFLALQPAGVLRLWGAGHGTSGTAALVAVGRAEPADIVAAWRSGVSWTMSPPLAHAGVGIVSSGITADGEVFVVVHRAGGSLQLETVVPHGQWQVQADLPPGTAAVSIGGAGVVDALAVTGTSTFTDWRRSAATGAWGKLQAMRVPVPFGSSS